MKVSAIATVLIASSVLVAGAAIERRNHVASVAPSPATHSAAPRAFVAPERIATVVTLPEITVRPSAEDIALAHAQPAADTETQAALPGPIKVNSQSNSGRLNFDMPYYSFGKALPHVSRD